MYVVEFIIYQYIILFKQFSYNPDLYSYFLNKQL